MAKKQLKTYKYLNGGWWELRNDHPYMRPSEEEGEFWVNSAGGWHPRHPDLEKDCKIIQSERWPKDDPDDMREEYLRETFRNGWINPRGWFYGCEYAAHDNVMHYVFKKKTQYAEEHGWVRVHPHTAQFGKIHYNENAKLTRAQVRTMEIIGFHRAAEGIFSRNENDIPHSLDIGEQVKLNYFQETEDAE